MIIKVPFTGEIISTNPLRGNPDNPLKPVDFQNLLPIEATHFHYKVIKYHLDIGEVELDITFEDMPIDIGEVDDNKIPILRKELPGEKENRIQRSIAALTNLDKVALGALK